MNLLKHLSIAVAILLGCANTFAQLTGTGCIGSTSYTNGLADDNIYYYPAGQQGTLTATPESGTPGWNFVWTSFNVGNSSWAPFFTESNVASSTISNLNPGAYGVTIFDGSGIAVGCYHAWVSQIISEPSVDVQPIAPGCTGPINLVGTINNGGVSPYSNLPVSQMLINSNTQISICFTGTHTFVSDIAFYAKGPASCGSPTLLLSPNPGANGQGSVCNSGNNISNLCFSSESSNNLNVCSAGAPLTGTYGSYGATNTPINWSLFNGCDASNGGWSVQIYDCIGGDVGALTDATLTFTGTDACGQPQTISYTTPPGYNSPIADMSCSASSASIFTVNPAAAPATISCQFGYEWSSEPYVYIADSTTSLNIQLDQLLDASGNPIPWQNIAFTLSITNSCDSIGGVNGCFGGNSSDTELFSFTQLQTVQIEPIAPVCITSSALTLNASIPGGIWDGPGIVDPTLGIFDPAISGTGDFVINYSVNDPCVTPGSTVISVLAEPVLNIDFPAGFCLDAGITNLPSDENFAGVFSGTGITNEFTGTFSPQNAGVGVFIITYFVDGICPIFATDEVEVYDLPIVNAGADSDVCPNAPYALFASGANTYQWSPVTYLNDATIQNPSASITANITYTVTGTDVNGCVDTDQMSLTLLPGPTVSAEDLNIVCPGTTVQLTATGSVGDYAWSPAAGLTGANTTNATAAPNVTTTYTVTVTDGCNLQATATVLVPVEQPYTVNAGPNEAYCEGQSVTITGSVVGALPTIQWTTNNGLINGSDASLVQTINTPGTYVLNVTTPVGCYYFDNVSITETPLPVLSIIDSTYICPGDTRILNAGSNWDNVLWSTGQTGGNIEVNQPGTYGLLVTDNNCSSSGSIYVYPIVLPYIYLGPDIEICQGDNVVIDAGYVGSWNTGATNSSINVSAEGTYSMNYQIETCSTTDSVNVIVHPLPFVSVDSELVGCIDQPFTIYAQYQNISGLVWNTGEVTPSIDVLTPDMYYVTAYNDCGSVTDYVDVNFEDCSYSIYLPNSFTPDNDGVNDVWKVTTFNVTEFNLVIFDRWGREVFKTQDPEAVWTGGVNDGEYYAPDGVYMYHAKFQIDSTEVIERSGNIFVLR